MTPVSLPPDLQDARAVPGYPGYFVQPDGAVWSRRGKRGATRVEPHVEDGQLHLQLNNGIKVVRVSAPRAICMAFHGNPPYPKARVVFLDGNTHNLSAENLRWPSPDSRS